MSDKIITLDTELLLFKALLEAVNIRKAKAYLVGGVVRDLIIHRELKILDYDFVLTAPAGEVAREVQKQIGGQIKEFPDFRTAKIIAPEKIPGLTSVDFVGARKETYPKPGALPITEEGSLSCDLARRDFTINAMALDLADALKLDAGECSLEEVLKKVIDPFNGLTDISERKIKVLHAQSFTDDPSRILRAARYRSRFDFTYDAETDRLKKQAIQSGALKTIQPYRIMNEFRRYSAEENFVAIFTELQRYGILEELGFRLNNKAEKFIAALSNLQQLRFAGKEIVYRTLISLVFYFAGVQAASELKAFNVRGDIKDEIIRNIISLGTAPERLETSQLIFNAILDSNFPNTPYLSNEAREQIKQPC